MKLELLLRQLHFGSKRHILSRYVAKTSMRQGTDLVKNMDEMEEDVNAHMIARQYAKEFNKALAAAGHSSQTVKYHPVNLVLLESSRSAPGPQTAMFLEPYLTGRYDNTF